MQVKKNLNRVKNKFVPSKNEDLLAENKEEKGKVAMAAATAAVSGQKADKKAKKVKEEKKKTSRLPWIIILLLLIGLVIAGYFFRTEVYHFLGIDKDQIVSDSTQTNDAHAADQHDETTADDQNSAEMLDSAAVPSENDGMEDMSEIASDENEEAEMDTEQEVAPEPTPAPVKNVSSGSGNYHLIGNSFSEKENADRFLKEMQDKGYPARIIGQFDGLYLVSLNSYPSNSAAYEGKASVASDASSAWVFKYPK
jgi:cell division septation protein DedD